MKSILKFAFGCKQNSIAIDGIVEIQEEIMKVLENYPHADLPLVYVALKVIEKSLVNSLTPYEKLIAKHIYKNTDTAITDMCNAFDGYAQETFEEQSHE